MSKLLIKGKTVISGTHRISGNKNAALPMIAAALLTKESVTLENVPDIADVANMLEAAKALGVTVSRQKPRGTVTLCAGRIRSVRIDARLAAKIRTSILFAGPLLARRGRAVLPPPGGDAIGRRRLDTHFAGFKALGAKVGFGTRSTSLEGALTGSFILLDEASVTATENILMAAVLAHGETVIFNAACEPHVVDLSNMLNAMGARIDGVGTNRLTVRGVGRLHGCTARIGCDYIEAGSYVAAAAVTGGEITLTNIDPEPFAILSGVFARFGIRWTFDANGRTLRYKAASSLSMQYDLGDAIPSVADGTWPAFPSDLMSVLIVVATQTRGTCLFFEKMFESRLYFVDRLRQMGAKIVQCDPHRAVVTGPSNLAGGLVAANDIRAGIALVIAALCADGDSVIEEAQTIDRGYPDVAKVINSLGARVRRIK